MGIDFNQYKSLLVKPFNLDNFGHNIKAFGYRLYFLFFETHSWETNQKLIERVYADWTHLTPEAKQAHFATIQKLCSKFLLCEENTGTLQLLQIELEKDSFINLPEEHRAMILRGAREFKANQEKGASVVSKDIHAYLVWRLFFHKPVSFVLADSVNGQLRAHLREHNSGDLIFFIARGEDQEECKEQGKAWTSLLYKLNNTRKEYGKAPFARVFFPLMLKDHGILAVIKLLNEDKVAVTVIDPFGPNSDYRPEAESILQGIQEGLPPNTRLEQEFSSVLQENGYKCGYHLILNIYALLENKPIDGRKETTIQAFIERIRQCVEEDIQRFSNNLLFKKNASA